MTTLLFQLCVCVCVRVCVIVSKAAAFNVRKIVGFFCVYVCSVIDKRCSEALGPCGAHRGRRAWKSPGWVTDGGGGGHNSGEAPPHG